MLTDTAWSRPYPAWNGPGRFVGWWQERRRGKKREFRPAPGMEKEPAPPEPKWR